MRWHDLFKKRFVGISIHAPHAGSDLWIIFNGGVIFISIHAPHAGSDLICARQHMSVHLFQSTLPIRGATADNDSAGKRQNFNPRSPYGERRWLDSLDGDEQAISIHAPHTGSDAEQEVTAAYANAISIHAPHTGSDLPLNVAVELYHAISIHAPHTGSDHSNKCRHKWSWNFNPRSPYGERRYEGVDAGNKSISIHAPHTGSDRTRNKKISILVKFQSTLPIRGATYACPLKSPSSVSFQSTLPIRGATNQAGQ